MDRLRKYVAILGMIVVLMTSTVFANFIVVTQDQVIVNNDSLFITVDGTPVKVESLNAANDGYLVAIPSPKTNICPNCGHEGYIPGRFCPWCNFPDDAKIRHGKNVSLP